MDMKGPRPRPADPADGPMFWEPSLAFLKYTVAFILAGCAAFVVAILIFAPDQAMRAFGPVSMSLVAAIAWVLLARGRIKTTVHVLAFGLWAVVTGMAFFTGGVGGTITIVYPQIILLLGWMTGARAAVAMAVLTVATTLGFALAESWGFLPLPPPTPPAMRWIVQSFVFAFSVVAIVYFVRSYQNRLGEAGKLGTELARRTAEVQAREADFNRAQAVAHVGSWVYDLVTDEMRLSAETCRIFGLPEGTRGSHESYLARVHPEDRSAVDSAWQAALKGGQPFDNEHRILFGNAIRWVRQQAELEFDAEGTPLRAVGTTQDITERVRLEQALRAQTERLLIGQRTARMVIMDWDIAKDELVWSDSPEWLRGPLPESGTYPLYVDQVHPEDRDGFLAVRAEGIATLQRHHQEYRIVRTDGRVLWVRSERIVLPGADGKAARMLVALQDITERKQAEARQAQLEAQLRELQKMEALGTLAGGVAHDFNNIVATIMGNVELARQDVGPGHAAQESLEEIRKASRRAKELVQQILAFGRRQVLDRQAISLAPVVQDSARLLRATLPAGVDLSVECAPDAPAVLADATQVQQVLLNLCANAWQAMQGQQRPAAIKVGLALYMTNGAPYAGPERRSRGGRVDLRPGRYACLTVCDTGPGIDRATRSRIFEPFFTTKPVGEGTGLGLAVVHGIVQDHGASIAVHSVPAEGTTFRIYFAAVEAPAPAVAELAPDRAPAHGQGRHILYIDDDEAIVFLMTRLLERQGYRVSGYTDARAALAAVRAEPDAFDLAVTDYNMPGMSGLEVARALREIRADLPVALASGYITEELRAEAPAAGVIELVYKPNTVEELCEMVARLAHAQPI
jgi:PAS domain S-box-containing protein